MIRNPGDIIRVTKTSLFNAGVAAVGEDSFVVVVFGLTDKFSIRKQTHNT